MVRYLVDEAGIRQFLDIGVGILTAGNVHEVARTGSDLFGPETSARLQNLNGRDSQQQYFHGTGAEVARFFDGTDLVPPGLVRAEEWRSGPATGDVGPSGLWAAVGRKR